MSALNGMKKEKKEKKSQNKLHIMLRFRMACSLYEPENRHTENLTIFLPYFYRIFWPTWIQKKI